MKRLKWIDLLRGFAMILVVLAHTGLKGYPKVWIYSFHMPLFFFISGLSYGLHPSGKEETFCAYATKKAKGLLLPYFFWSAVLIPAWWLNFCYFGKKTFSLKNQVEGILFSNHAASHPGAPNNAMWFLPCMFLVAVLFWLCERWAEENEKHLTLLVLALFLLGAAPAGTDKVREPWHIRTALVALLFYYCGYQFIRNKDVVTAKLRQAAKGKLGRYLGLAFLLLAAGSCAAYENGKISMHANDYHSVTLFLIAALALTAGFVLLAMWIGSIPVLNYIGQNTVAYLCFHIPILRFFQNYWRLKWFYQSCPLGVAAFAVVVLLPVSWVGSRYFPVLFGKKKRKKEKS